MKSPKCLKCGSSMQKRLAKKGSNAGGYFWGCTNFPKCRGTLDYIESENNQSTDLIKVNRQKDLSTELSKKEPNEVQETYSKKILVPWSGKARHGFISNYLSIGSIPSFTLDHFNKDDDSLKKSLSQTLLLINRNKDVYQSENTILLSTLLTKILQRGNLPISTIGIEKKIIEKFKLSKLLDDKEDEEDLQNTLKENSISRSSVFTEINSRKPFIIDPEFVSNPGSDSSLFDSKHEVEFIKNWVPKELGKSAGQWFIPQANLDLILEANGLESSGSRRIDFLFSHPESIPIAIEIDGDEHQDKKEIDDNRDQLLESCGIRVIRIENYEIIDGNGANLDELSQLCKACLEKNLRSSKEETLLSKAIVASAFATKVQYAFIMGIRNGWLKNNEEWSIFLKNADIVDVVGLIDIVEMIRSFNKIYEIEIFPTKLRINTDDISYSYDLEKRSLLSKDLNKKIKTKLSICIEKDLSQYHEIDTNIKKENYDLVIRPAYLPVLLSYENFYTGGRKKIKSKTIDESYLEVFLQNIFRKNKFRSSQMQGVINVLAHIDSVVLLPTGAGKSIIYQLSGLLMPGITLVVDPINALIDDQIEGMQSYGIDRVCALTSDNIQQSLSDSYLGCKRGDYLFILHSPERLQDSKYRVALKEIAQTSYINLAVIDEAHCVSEWGHDFRPAYLNLKRNVQEFGKNINGESPPIIALTGTASRAVLRDVLTDLEIDRNNETSVIRPVSFDRKELNFFISRTEQVEYSEATFKGVIKSLPGKFNLPQEEFFQPAGKKTASGIIFVPWASKKGAPYGVMHTKNLLDEVTRTSSTFYSGGAPMLVRNDEWKIVKKNNVRKFKSNQSSLLVATKAFGMGIDKSNIRYTIHYNVPGSIESFYQEAGRAGRDRKISYCGIVFSEYDKDRTNSLLDPTIDLEELRKRYDKVKSKRNESDDILRLLFFHTNNFSGQAVENNEIKKTLEYIQSLENAQTIEVPFTDTANDTKQERSIYRLTKVGVFRDYEKSHGSKSYKIYTNKFELESSKQRLMQYVVSAQPGRIKAFEQSLDQINSSNNLENASLLSQSLIEFTYDVIEKSRRNAIREMVNLAREGKSNSIIKSRLLNYLQEGIGSQQVQELLEQTSVKLLEWIKYIQRIDTPIDADEFRGDAIRELESFPDHPGLLLMRSISELLCSDIDEDVVLQNLVASIEYSFSKYSIIPNDWIDVFDWLIGFLSSRKKGKISLIALAVNEAIFKKFMPKSLANYCLEELSKIDNKETKAVNTVFNTISVTEEVEKSVLIVQNTIKDRQLEPLI